MEKWDERFLNLAKHISTWSKDPKCKVGAVIVNDQRQVLGLGYNGFPRGVRDTEDRLGDRTIKHYFVSHAERNALDNCFADLKLHEATLYTTVFPCCDCAKSIVQRGIKRVVTHEPDPSMIGRGNFFPPAVHIMFEEAGVDFKIIETEDK